MTTATDHDTDAELAKRYRETYGRDSYTPELLEHLIATAPVIRRERRTPAR